MVADDLRGIVKAVVLVCILVLVLASCGEDSGTLVLIDTDSGSEVEVAGGEVFEVQLASNPSTGYSWEVDAMSTPGLVELVRRTFVDPSAADVVGAEGTEVFVFEAGAAGAGVLRLAYLRSFEELPVPERVVEFIVCIDGAAWPPESNDGQPPTRSTATADVGTLGVGGLIAGEAVDRIVVSGFVIWDESGARLCELLAESMPPQCGGRAVVLANPDLLELTFAENQGVRWTQGRVDIIGAYDGASLTVTP